MIAVLGGPHDGSEHVNRAPSFEFVWFDGKRCFRKPGKGRTLYRLMNQPKGGALLVYVQQVYILCECGVYHSRSAASCSMCGAVLTA